MWRPRLAACGARQRTDDVRIGSDRTGLDWTGFLLAIRNAGRESGGRFVNIPSCGWRLELPDHNGGQNKPVAKPLF